MKKAYVLCGANRVCQQRIDRFFDALTGNFEKYGEAPLQTDPQPAVVKPSGDIQIGEQLQEAMNRNSPQCKKLLANQQRLWKKCVQLLNKSKDLNNQSGDASRKYGKNSPQYKKIVLQIKKIGLLWEHAQEVHLKAVSEYKKLCGPFPKSS